MCNQPTSFDKLILEAYKRTEIKSEIKSGWSAGPDQKSYLKGLKVLLDAKLSNKETILAGSIAYLKEESLHNILGKNKYKSDTLSGEFIVVNLNDVEYIVPPPGDAA
jgi:hypothetical protein